jgi:hypothetical protein
VSIWGEGPSPGDRRLDCIGVWCLVFGVWCLLCCGCDQKAAHVIPARWYHTQQTAIAVVEVSSQDPWASLDHGLNWAIDCKHRDRVIIALRHLGADKRGEECSRHGGQRLGQSRGDDVDDFGRMMTGIKAATKTTTVPGARRRAGGHNRCILRHEARRRWYTGSRRQAYLRRSVDSRGTRETVAARVG